MLDESGLREWIEKVWDEIDAGIWPPQAPDAARANLTAETCARLGAPFLAPRATIYEPHLRLPPPPPTVRNQP